MQDFDSVHHAQRLIAKYLSQDLNVAVKKMHEFTDGCAAQYKSRHCIGDLSCCVADFGFPIQHNYFETSHAKGEQDAAGSHVKQQSTLVVIRGRADITHAKQLCDHLTVNFSKPAQSSFPSHSTVVSLKRRLFYYVPAEEEGVPRNRDGRRFKTIKGIRKLHSVLTSPQQLKVLVRQRSCYCDECLYENYSSCKNKDLVDDFENVKLERKAYPAVTHLQYDQPSPTGALHLHVADLVNKGSIIDCHCGTR